jgi:hypothetical protein
MNILSYLRYISNISKTGVNIMIYKKHPFLDCEVSDEGLIRRIHKHRGTLIEFPGTENNGYRVFSILRQNYKVHRVVAETFIPNPENLPFVDHIDGNRSNNRVENLRWVSTRVNTHNKDIHREGKLVGAIYCAPRNKLGVNNNLSIWKSRINVNGKDKHLGYFKTEQEAHDRYVLELNRLDTKGVSHGK